MNCLKTPIDEFTDSSIESSGVRALALGLKPAPSVYSNFPFDYFVTIAFPTNQKFKIKHLELCAQGRSRIVFSDIKYGDCTQDEQYKWIMHCLTKNIYSVCDVYHIFVEYTKLGNIHLHCRLGYEADSRKKTMKDIRALFHRIFDCSTQYTKFVDIKKYDITRWNDYENKQAGKRYQSSDYPAFCNL